LEIQVKVKHAKVGCKAPRSTPYVPRHVSVISRDIRDRVFGEPQPTRKLLNMTLGDAYKKNVREDPHLHSLTRLSASLDFAFRRVVNL